MSKDVFSNYSNAGEILQNQRPAIEQYPWILQRDSQTKLVQPHERGTFFTPGGKASVPATKCPCKEGK